MWNNLNFQNSHKKYVIKTWLILPVHRCIFIVNVVLQGIEVVDLDSGRYKVLVVDMVLVVGNPAGDIVGIVVA